MISKLLFFVVLCIFAGNVYTYAQIKPASLKGSVLRVKVHSKNIEGNLAGDSPDIDVSIYLPPTYKKNPAKKYPVVYFLHGYTDDDAKWYGFEEHWINLPKIADSFFIASPAAEVIFVTPNGFNKYQVILIPLLLVTGKILLPRNL